MIKQVQRFMNQNTSAYDEAIEELQTLTDAARMKARQMKHIRLFTRLGFIAIVLLRLPPPWIAIALIVVVLVSIDKLW